MAVALRAIAEAAPAAGDNALVYGVGPIGLHLIVALRAAGAGTIVAVGRSSAGRRAAAAAVGADVVLDSRETEPAEYVRQAGLEIAHAYDCAGDPNVLLSSCRALRAGGTLVGVALGRTPSLLDTHLFVARSLRMVSACAYGNGDFGRALELVAAQPAAVERLISERIGLEAGPDAFIRLRTPGDLVAVLVQPWRI
jgi:threonine dehydrogenase-like Zn-dependent dehydrogenase